MASQKLFDQVPPFPNDLPLAPIQTVSYAGLQRGAKSDLGILSHAAQGAGFFFLDLQGDSVGEAVMQHVDDLFGAMVEIMNLSDQIKREFEHDGTKSFIGFKPRGTAKIETGLPDRFEWFNLAVDGLSGVAPLQPIPDLMKTYQPLLTTFTEHCRTVLTILNEVLAVQLQLPSNTFTSLSPPDKPSGSIVRMIKVCASSNDDDLRTSMHHHTDFGTVTLLANVLGGLQILREGADPKQSDAWLWVRPQPGCLIVNLGDAMHKWTGGILHSSTHRIYHAPGMQRYVDRYSLAVLFRPEREASMKRITGSKDSADEPDITAWQWELERMLSFRRAP